MVFDDAEGVGQPHFYEPIMQLLLYYHCINGIETGRFNRMIKRNFQMLIVTGSTFEVAASYTNSKDTVQNNIIKEKGLKKSILITVQSYKLTNIQTQKINMAFLYLLSIIMHYLLYVTFFKLMSQISDWLFLYT